MMRLLLLPALALAAASLSGCGTPLFPAAEAPPPVEAAVTPAAAIVVPPVGARTAEEFDTTTAEERAAAVATPAAATETRLGTTIATLGPPAEAGLWLTTGLVTEATQGRVEYPAMGTSVALELRPSGGAATAGSQISLAAMRLLEAPLTGLPELVVYRN